MKTSKQVVHIVNAFVNLFEKGSLIRNSSNSGGSKLIVAYTKRCEYLYYIDPKPYIILHRLFKELDWDVQASIVSTNISNVVPRVCGVKTYDIKFLVADNNFTWTCLLKADWFISGGIGDGALNIWDVTWTM